MIALEPLWIGFLVFASFNVARQILSKCTGMYEDESQSSISTTTSGLQSEADRMPTANTPVRISELTTSDTTNRRVKLAKTLIHADTLMRTPSPCDRGIINSEPPHLNRINHIANCIPISPMQRPVSDGYLEEIYRGGGSYVPTQNLCRTEKVNMQSLVSSRSCGDLGIRNCSSTMFERLSLASILFRMKYPTCDRSDSFSQGEKTLTPVASNKRCKVLQSLTTDGAEGEIAPQGEDGEEEDDELSFYNKSVYSFGQRVLQSYDDMSFILIPESQSPSNSTQESTLNGEYPCTNTSPPPPPPLMPLLTSTKPPSCIDVHLAPSWKTDRNHSAIPLVPRLQLRTSNVSHIPCHIEPPQL